MNPSHKTSALDLYSKVEDMIGVKEVAPKLYAHYLLTLQSIEFNALLDIGCGSGDFLHSMSGIFDAEVMRGIDLSPLMIEKAQGIGVDASCMDLCAVDASFDVMTATFDMLNYLDDSALARFLTCVTERLHDGGYLLCDINTLYGFEEVAVGSFIADENDRFLCIDSDFADGVYSSEFTLFEREDDRYIKSKEHISQYYHEAETIARLSGLELVSEEPVSLYGEESDKAFLVFRKTKEKK